MVILPEYVKKMYCHATRKKAEKEKKYKKQALY